MLLSCLLITPFVLFILGFVKQGHENFILVPIAFVNEHIETLHEMDIEYCKDLGEEVRRILTYLSHCLIIYSILNIYKV